MENEKRKTNNQIIQTVKAGKEMDVIEGNKMIAEFMGAKFSSEDAFGNGDTRYYAIYDYGFHPDMMIISAGRKFELSDLIYHKSFNWLMPVVEKIENDGNTFVRIEGSRLSDIRSCAS